MATDPKAAEDKLKGLRSKLPRSAPQYLQKDYADFLKKVDTLMTDLEQVVADTPSAKDRQEYDTKKKALATLKTKINTAASTQKGEISSLQKETPGITKAASTLLDTLKDKTGKDEVNLAKSIQGFWVAMEQQTNNLEAAAPVDD